MRYADLGVILAYLVGITWFGWRFRENQRSLRDYFLGGRTTPWWAIAFSIVSAETSTLTVIGTPAISFNGNFGFLQVVFGYLLARIVIATLLLAKCARRARVHHQPLENVLSPAQMNPAHPAAII